MEKAKRGSAAIILQRTKQVGECLEWQGMVDKDGYPKGTYVTDGKKCWRTVRALMQRLGYDIEGMVVRHACDNPLCLNPNHLRIGTIEDNIKDRQKRDRQAKGSRMANTWLYEEDIIQMRQDRANGMTYKELAETYGYSHASAAHQAINKHWKHVDDGFILDGE